MTVKFADPNAPRAEQDGTSIEYLSPDQLVVEPSAQRPLSMAHVMRIAKAFDPKRLGVIEVTRREDGRFNVNDGSHRVSGAKAAKWDGKFLAHVHEAMSIKDQAELFLGLNTQRVVSPVDKFRVEVTAEHPLPVLVERALRVRGWQVGGSGARRTTAITALKSIAKRSPDHLDRVINIIDKAWGGEPKSMPADVTKALGLIIADQGWLDTDHMVEALRAVTPQMLQAKAAAAQETAGIGKAVALRSLIAREYNKGLRSSRKLELPGDFGLTA